MQDQPLSFNASLAGSFIRVSAVSLAVMLASGCTILQEDKIDYKSAKSGTALDVPPDLTQLNRENRYNTAVVTTSSSAQQAAELAPKSASTAIKALGDVRIERNGNQRWLVVQRSADRLWVPVIEFWKENGFELSIEQEKIGIMETGWAENRAKIPQDLIRSTLGKVFDSLYSSGERDKFRTRLERSGEDATEIYISHRGMEEIYANSQKDQTAWQSRASDPELETEFLRRLMIKLGATTEQASAAVMVAPKQPSVHVSNETLVLDEGFDVAWRRIGLALDRTGFTVEDRDRAQGVYFVRYIPVNSATDGKNPGFLSRLFGSEQKETPPIKYQIKVEASGSSSKLTVLDAQGQFAPKTDASRILQLLVDSLN